MQAGEDLTFFGVEISNPVWRVSPNRYPPLMAPPAHAQVHGRFDDPFDAEKGASETYSVLYAAQSPTAAFIEATASLRPRLGAVEELIAQTMTTVEEREALSTLQVSRGIVTRDWQAANQLTSGTIATSTKLFDLTSAGAVQSIRFFLAPSLIAMGLDDLDFAALLGTNRALTQAISRWLWTMQSESSSSLFSGIRYRSRFDPECICLALYEGRYRIDGGIDIQPITRDVPGFAEAAGILRLNIG